MRLPSVAIPHATSPAPIAARASIVLHPFQGWMKLLFIGALFGIGAFAIDALWSVIVLTARVRGFPPLNLLTPYEPFFALGTISFQWAAIWLLTTEDPTPHRTPRRRANALRLLVSASFLLLSFGTLHLIGWEGRRQALWFIGTVNLLDLATTLLLWPHLFDIASRLSFRDLRWRIVVTMIGQLITASLFCVPVLAGWWFDRNINLDRIQQSARSGMVVLWAVVSGLVMLRFAYHFFHEWRGHRLPAKSQRTRDESSVGSGNSNFTRLPVRG